MRPASGVSSIFTSWAISSTWLLGPSTTMARSPGAGLMTTRCEEPATGEGRLKRR